MKTVFWTDELIEDKVLEAKSALGIDRMPTERELRDFYGNSSLTYILEKTGGLYHWAETLGLAIKDCETLQGYMAEAEIKKQLESLGFTCELTSTRFPYDILVDGCVKVDVKSAHRTKANGSETFTFDLAKRQPTCDIYIAVCLDDTDSVERIYIIPAHIMAGKTQLSIGIHKSKYDIYINRWDIVRTYEMAFTGIS